MMLSAPMRLALAVTVGAAVVSTDGALKVLRVSPQNAAESTDDITVTFDRPIAAGLDSTVDPKAFFAITPRVMGKLEWRDPVTIRLHPAAPLPAGVTYTVKIANTFKAMDGSQLDAPYSFSFRVRGPKILDASPVNQWSSPLYLTPGTHFTLLVSAPANLSLLAGLMSADVGRCVRGKTIPLRPLTQRRIGKQDERWRYYGTWTGGDTTKDLRRDLERPRTGRQRHLQPLLAVSHLWTVRGGGCGLRLQRRPLPHRTRAHHVHDAGPRRGRRAARA